MRVGERDVVTANYTPLLAPGETILQAVWSATVVRGIDPNPAAIIQGISTVSGPMANQMIAPTVPAMTYRLICTAQTSLGRELILPDPGYDQLYVPS
jgi:hypothetical protein